MEGVRRNGSEVQDPQWRPPKWTREHREANIRCDVVEDVRHVLGK